MDNLRSRLATGLTIIGDYAYRLSDRLRTANDRPDHLRAGLHSDLADIIKSDANLSVSVAMEEMFRRMRKHPPPDPGRINDTIKERYQRKLAPPRPHFPPTRKRYED